MVVNFTLVTEVQGLVRRDFPVDDPDILDPNGTNPLIDGEFMNLNSSYKLIRGVDATPGWAVFSERGRFDVQFCGKPPSCSCVGTRRTLACSHRPISPWDARLSSMTP